MYCQPITWIACSDSMPDIGRMDRKNFTPQVLAVRKATPSKNAGIELVCVDWLHQENESYSMWCNVPDLPEEKAVERESRE